MTPAQAHSITEIFNRHESAAHEAMTAAMIAMQDETMGAIAGRVVHRIDPFAVATLCGASGEWLAVNTAAGVTCPVCLQLQTARLVRAQEAA